jgi:hypothetical protein
LNNRFAAEIRATHANSIDSSSYTVDMLRTYEERLDADAEWALSEGSRHFDKSSAVHDALREIALRMEAMGIPYAVVGGMALFLHGFRRFTEDVDVLVTADGLRAIQEQLIGRGYIPLFQGSKNLRDAEHGVRIEFLVTGGYPGDGKPKAVAFPDPAETFVEISGIRCLPLEKILELKLASGMTNAGRIRDLGDVQELIRHLALGVETAERLDPSVRDKFKELWHGVQENPAEP